jgi:hypothetical protein
MAAPVMDPVDRLDELIGQLRAAIAVEPESTVYRLSAAGTLARRDHRREAGGAAPHWIVVDVPAGAVHHHIGQLLPDAAVADWSPLVRAWSAIEGTWD